MRRLIALAVPLALVLPACEADRVESCPAGQGITLDDAAAPLWGSATAPVKVELFGDFQCPGTRALWFGLVPFLERLSAEGRADALQLRFHHFPLTALHSRAWAASLAAEAAHAQGDGAFWAIFPLLLRTSAAELTDADIAGYAEIAGLDEERFAADLASEEVAAAVERDLALSLALDLPGTPSVLLCGVAVDPDPDPLVDNLEYLIE